LLPAPGALGIVVATAMPTPSRQKRIAPKRRGKFAPRLVSRPRQDDSASLRVRVVPGVQRVRLFLRIEDWTEFPLTLGGQ